MASQNFTMRVVVLVLSLIAVAEIEARGARGGGFRSGGARYSRYSGTSRYSGGNSYSSYRSTSYSGTRLYSSYATSTQSFRYTRAYSGYRGYYYYYYNMYFYYGSSYAYYRRSGYNDGGSQGVCVNYEASDNGTAMGVFTCPFPFEPNTFTACCGEKYAEYCCEPTSSSMSSLPIIIICAIAGFIFVAVFITICLKKCPRKNKGIISPRPNQMNGRPPPPPPPGRGPQPHGQVSLTRRGPPNTGQYPMNYNNQTYQGPGQGPPPYPPYGQQMPASAPPYPPAPMGAPQQHGYPTGGPGLVAPMPAPYGTTGPTPAVAKPPAYNEAVKNRPSTGMYEEPPKYGDIQDRY